MSENNNFIPQQKSYVTLTPFHLFIKNNFPFIEDTFEALDNYGLYCKLVEYLNKVIENENVVTDNTRALYNAFVELNNYVSNYFDNLDVQEEINNKLDDMVEAGTLQEIIGEYLNATAFWGFDTVADMKSSTNLINGSYAKTLGYYAINDKGGAVYYITDTEPENIYYETLESGLYAIIVENSLTTNVEKYGALNNGDISSILNYLKDKFKKIEFYNNTYIVKNVEITNDIILKGNGTTLKGERVNNTSNRFISLFIFSGTNNVKIENINFEGYNDVVTQTGDKETENSMIYANSLKNLIIKNCSFKNIDNSYSLPPDTYIIYRKPCVLTAHDCDNVRIKGCEFNTITGEEAIWVCDVNKNREDVNFYFENNTVLSVSTSIIDFIGNICSIKNNYYDSTYTGSLMNIFGLYDIIEDEEIHGSYNSIYDNCEQNYFQGKEFIANNIINYANLIYNAFGVQAEKSSVTNFKNNSSSPLPYVYRDFFIAGSSTIHKDCATTPLSYMETILNNCDLIGVNPVYCINDINKVPYKLTIMNSILKSTADISTSSDLVRSSEVQLNLFNNNIYNTKTQGSGTPVTFYNNTSKPFVSIKAYNNLIHNLGGSANLFCLTNTDVPIIFVGNETDVTSNIASDMSVVKAACNIGYNET